MRRRLNLSPLTFSLGLFLSLGCQSAKKEVQEADFNVQTMHKLPAAEQKEPRLIQLKGTVGTKETLSYSMVSHLEVRQDRVVNSRKTEAVQFKVHQSITQVDDQSLSALVTTSNKSGEFALEDLALPEIGESLETKFSKTGRILKAGSHSPQSVYFVPSLLFSEKAVAVGDTWVLDHTWESGRDGIPYRVELVHILKGWVNCSEPSPCAEIELSGKVSLAKDVGTSMKFVSEWNGRALVSVEKGQLLGVRMHSWETVNYDRMERRVRTCVEGRSDLATTDLWVAPDLCSGFAAVTK